MNAREIAALVVHDVVKQKAHAKESLDRALAQHDLTPRDRAFCTELTYGTLRFWPAIVQSLKDASTKKRKIDRRIVAHLGVAAYQILYMPKVPTRAAVHAAVDAVKRVRREHSGFANAVLRALEQPLHEKLSDDATLPELAAAFGLPEFAAQAYVGKRSDARAILSALCQRPPIGVRILDEKHKEELLAEWNARGNVEAHEFVKDCYLVSGAGSPATWPGYQEGAFVVADPGSLLVGDVVDAQPGQSVCDFCAAPGTKSVVLGRALGQSLHQKSASLTCVEREEHRAKRLSENLKRFDIPAIVEVKNALTFKGAFDSVLVDAPCTGYGTLRRKPEIKLHKDVSERDALAKIQHDILAHAASCVAPGGTLVYAVCSPLPEEGRDVVAAFLAKHAHFERVPLSALPESAQDDHGALRLHTDLHKSDAFYAARLRRVD